MPAGGVFRVEKGVGVGHSVLGTSGGAVEGGTAPTGDGIGKRALDSGTESMLKRKACGIRLASSRPHGSVAPSCCTRATDASPVNGTVRTIPCRRQHRRQKPHAPVP